MADYKTMKTAEIRDDFLSFFESKGCKRYPSSSLVPSDPSLLLANAGMNQFKEYYQGIKTMKEIGATSCQKCLRTNDIDNIGDSAISHSLRCWVTSPLVVTPSVTHVPGQWNLFLLQSTWACLLIVCTLLSLLTTMRQLRSGSLLA